MAAEEIIDFRGERSRHRYFVGREDVLAEIDRALFDGSGDAQWVLVTGNPGMGKSALLSAFVERVKARAGSEPPHHFLRRGVSDWDQPDAVVRSLAAQVEALFPEQSEAKTPPEMRLWRRLVDVSEKVLVPEHQRLVLIVDGLDEVQGSEGTANPLPLFLPPSLPRGVVLLCASRPVYPHLEWLESQGSVFSIDLGDERWIASNESACRELLHVRSAALSPALEAGFIEAAARRAEGNLLYADRLVEWLRSQPVERRRVELLPRGIEAFLTQVWERLRALPADGLDQGARGLGVLCAAREALPFSALSAAAGWPASDLDARERFLRAARTLLLREETAPGSDEEEAYRPYHESFRAFMAKKLGPEAMRGHHAALLDTVAAWPARESAGAFERRYALRHALAHAVSAKAWGKARALATDVGFLEAACEEAGTWALENALQGVASALSGVDEESAAEIGDVHRAVRVESHWLGQEPGALPRLVYNRLLCAGWEPPRIEQRLRFPDGLPAYRLRLPMQMTTEVERTLIGHSGMVNACAITPDGRRIVSASNDQTLKVWDLDSGRLLRSLRGHSDGVTACAITPDGQRIVSGSHDKTLKLWDLHSGRLLHSLEGHSSSVKACAITFVNRRIVSASWDETVKVWDLDSGRLLHSFEGHSSSVTACAITPDGRRIVSGSYDRTLKVWDLESRQLLRSLEGHSEPVTTCAITPDGRRIVSTSSDKTLKVWDLASGRLLRSLAGHANVVTACAITPDGQRIVSGSSDKTLKVWDLASGRLLRSLAGHANMVTACAITPDGQRVVSGSYNHTLEIWDLDSKRFQTSLARHSSSIRACAITARGRRIVSASEDETLKVWDLDSGQLLRSLKGHSGWVTACAITPDGQRVVSASDDHTLKVWDLDSGRLQNSLEGHFNWVTACAITPDGRRIVSACWDTTLKVWDLDSGRLLRSLKGHSGSVAACAITPDGQQIVSASNDRTLKVWDLDSGQLLRSLVGHSGSVKVCAITPDGRRIVSASHDRTLKVWDIATGACETTLHGVATFHCVALTPSLLCAGDELGDLWLLETTSRPGSLETTSPPRPLRLFYSYSHADEALRGELDAHLAILKRQGILETWHDRRIEPGADRVDAIDRNLAEADIILLLVSADFIASQHCYENDTRVALDRHRSNHARVIPVLLRPAHLEGAPFQNLQALPTNLEPVTSSRWSTRDEAWADVVRGIRLAAESLRGSKR